MGIHEEKISVFSKYGYRIMNTSFAAVDASELSDKRWQNARKGFASNATRESVLGLLDTSVLNSGKSGYLFTDEKVYYLETLSKPKKLWYDEIESVSVVNNGKSKDEDRTIEFKMKDGSTVSWSSCFLNKTPLCELFKEIIAIGAAVTSGCATIEHHAEPNHAGATASGLGVGGYQNVNKIYEEERFHSHQGHGFAAERANNLFDKMTGHDARILGDDNAKNGADRMVDGVYIQSKYCATGARCINECFESDGSGTFRYMIDGHPMQIEVPSDKYTEAVESMRRKIENGQVPGVSDPKDAEKFVRKGHFSYAQAKNIAKAGTIESLTYDAASGTVVAASSFGVTALITFATSVWNGEDFDVSLKNSALAGIKVGGTAFITTVVSSQLSKAGLNSAMVKGSEAIVRAMGPKAYQVLANAFRPGAKAISGAAAMKSAAKLFRSNAITSGVTFVVLSAADVTNIFRRRISGKQLLKNLANTAGTVAGGTGGWIGGAAVGSMIMPGVGTVVGGIVGSLAGGGAAGKATNAVTKLFGKDDAEEMVQIIQSEFQSVSDEYLLNANEAEKCVDILAEKLDGKKLKDMFASNDRNEFAKNLITPIVEARVSQRKRIALPSAEDMVNSTRTILEEIADEEPVESDL